MTIIVIFAVLLGLGSAATNTAVDGKNGYRAPMFRVERNDSVIALDDMKGKWVLLQFWTSSDPASRIACRDYSDFEECQASDNFQERFRLLSVNLDRSERLFREIVPRDGLSAKSQFHVKGSQANQLIKDYHLESGMKSFLIDPQGRIVAKNPTEKMLKEIAIN